MNSSERLKKQVFRAIGCGFFWGLAAFLFLHLNYFISPNESGNYRFVMPAFYAEPENSLDIITVGNSGDYRYIDTPWLWSQKGYTAYNIAFGSTPVEAFTYLLEEARKTQSPQVYLIEVRSFLRSKMSEKTLNITLHRVTDGLDFSWNRLQLIRESIPDPSDWLEYLFPVVAYHDLWESLGPDNREFADNRVSLRQKGWKNKLVQKDMGDLPVYEGLQAKKLITKAQRELAELLEYCRENGLPVVFFESPYYRKEKAAARTLTVKNLIESYGYEFWDLNEYAEEIGIDTSGDFYNANHMNTLGARKVTSWLAERLEAEGLISPASHSPEVTAGWDRAGAREAQVVDNYLTALEAGEAAAADEED